MKIAIELITHWDSGELVDPPRILLPDGELIKPQEGNNGWLFVVDIDKLAPRDGVPTIVLSSAGPADYSAGRSFRAEQMRGS